MAKFISIPIGLTDNTNKTTRNYTLINLDAIIQVTPDPNSQFSSRVITKGGRVVQAYRRYDTLVQQITGRTDLMENYPDEEISAAYEAGFNKALAQNKQSTARKQMVRQLTTLAAEWFEHNPLTDGWRGRFRKWITAQMLEAEESAEGEQDIIDLEEEQ